MHSLIHHELTKVGNKLRYRPRQYNTRIHRERYIVRSSFGYQCSSTKCLKVNFNVRLVIDVYLIGLDDDKA